MHWCTENFFLQISKTCPFQDTKIFQSKCTSVPCNNLPGYVFQNEKKQQHTKHAKRTQKLTNNRTQHPLAMLASRARYRSKSESRSWLALSVRDLTNERRGLLFSGSRGKHLLHHGCKLRWAQRQGCHFGLSEAKFQKFGLLENQIASKLKICPVGIGVQTRDFFL